MYRDGNFQSLRWNMLEASHKAHWEKLSSVYGLEEPEKLLKSEAQKKDMPVLDQLAELCICSCQNYLFSLTPVKDVLIALALTMLQPEAFISAMTICAA